jgi:hypothetical protein
MKEFKDFRRPGSLLYVLGLSNRDRRLGRWPDGLQPTGTARSGNSCAARAGDGRGAMA